MSIFPLLCMSVMQNKTILTITGSDSTGGSGVQADIKTIMSLGCTAVSAITSITVQNTLGIQEFYDLPSAVVGGQIDAIINDVQPQAVKIGMVRRAETLDVIVKALRRYVPQYVIYDPVLFSSRGDRLMGEDMLRQVRSQLFPLCTAIVVSCHDAGQVVGDSIYPNVYYMDDTAQSSAQFKVQNLHGLANGFSSSLAAYLCQGLSMEDAIEKAREFCRHEISSVPVLQGRGNQLYNDFIHLVQRHYGEKNDVAYYADKLNVGSAYLGQVCRRVAGRSPKAIIDDCLIKEVERQLRETPRSIQEIASGLGFSSQAHLSRFFKKMVGVAPSSYRQK